MKATYLFFILVGHQSFRGTVKKEKRDKNFIHKPIYPGGNEAFKTFIRNNLKYPKEAFLKKIEGVVRIRYHINYEGKVTDTQVLTGLGYGCDEEAVRLVKMLKFEVPKHRGVKVAFHKTTNIHFKLPKSVETSLSYTVTSKSKMKDSDPKPQSSYAFTINLKS